MYEKKSYLRFYGAGHAVLTRCIHLLNISLAVCCLPHILLRINSLYLLS